MFRLIYYLLLMVLAISVVRAIIGTLARAFAAFTGVAPNGAQRHAMRDSVPLTGELKRDPVCGTFVAESSALKLTDGAQTVHFCSSACRDKYVVAARR